MTGLDAASAALEQDLAAMTELSRRIAEQIGGGPAGSPPDGRVPGTEKPAGTDRPPVGAAPAGVEHPAVSGQAPATGTPAITADPVAPGKPPVAEAPATAGGTAATGEAAAAEQAAAPRRVHGPWVTVSRASGMVQGGAPRSQQDHLDDLVRRYTAKTPTSKQIAQRYRRVLADSRAVVGFRSGTKEMLYPIAGRRASGARLQDVDGNEYVDITMGFGVLLFGHEPAFVSEAVREHLGRGIQLGPRNAETGEAAELLAGMTGMERVAFANSGTEANSAAIRLARSATGRNKIVTFLGAYHGHADTVLGRSSGGPGARVTVPVSRGIPDSAVSDLIVLEYGGDASLEAIAQQAGDIAAVIIEPVQSRHPELQPVEFVRKLRELTARLGIILMFDEMLTGFRPALRGAQELYGVTPDLATYGKLLGGGFPIGAIAGRADIMDGVDGGYWSYGDNSYPPADTTFFGGTYIQHPVSMVAARAVLTHLKEHSPLLQERLNARTGELAAGLNAFFEAEEFPLRMSHFGSQFRFDHRADMELLYHHLMLRGVHVWEWRNFFLSTAHSDGDLEFIADAVKGSLRELRGAGFFPGAHRAAPAAGGASLADLVTVAAKAPEPAAPPRGSAPDPGPQSPPATAGGAPNGHEKEGDSGPLEPSVPGEGKVSVLQAAGEPGRERVSGPQETGRPATGQVPGLEGLGGPGQERASSPHEAGGPGPQADSAGDGPRGPGRRVAAMAWNTAAAVAPAAPQGTSAPAAPQATSAPAAPQATPAPAAPQAAPRTPDFSVYFFGDYPQDAGAGAAPRVGKYELLLETARFADRNGFHALWMPERHFHSFGGLFPNPAVLAAALSRETSRIRLNAGSVVLPIHDPIRVAEEWSMVDNLSGGRVGIGIASGWHANDFVFFPERFGRHKEAMYEQLEQVRRFWRGEALRRTTGDGEADVRLFPRPVQDAPPMYTAVVGNPASFELAARHDLGVVTNLMTQSVEQLAENVALYRRTREQHGLDPAAGRVAVLMHTYLAGRHDVARAEAYEPLSRYMRASLSLFGGVTNSLGHNVDLSSLSEDDLDVVFRRAYDRYCDQRALIGTVDSVSSVVHTVTAAGADEIVSLVDFGVAPDELRASLTHIDALRRRHRQVPAGTGAGTEGGAQAPAPALVPAALLTPAPVPAPADAPADAPLSPGQQRIWFLERMLPGRTAYNETKAIRLDGPLDVAALRAALRGLVARHEGLRTVFRETGNEPRQVVRAPAEPDFAVVDGTGRGEAAVQEVLAAESARRFDLAEGPLFVTRLVKLADDAHVLVLSLHHIVVDAASATVLTRDLSALYRAWRDGTELGLPELTWSYAEHAREQAAALEGPEAAADLAYWRETLGGGLPALNLPTDRPRPAVMTSNGRAVFRTLDPELSTRLRELSRARRGTLFMTLLAGYVAMLHRVTGQDDIVIGTPISDRPQHAEDLLGFFVNTLALRFDLSGDPSFAALLDRVRGRALDAYDHAGVPFEAVVRELAPPRVLDRTPVFQVLAEFQSSEPFRFELPGVRATPLDAGPDKALTDFTVYFTDQPQGIRCHLEYNTDLFDPETAERFFGTFRDLLAAAVEAPEAPLSRLAATAAPGDPVPAAWQNGPVRPVATGTVHELVARQAAAAPDATAVIDGATVLTYRGLEERAERLAAVLRERGGDGAPVALWLPRSADLVVAMLAALKTGRAYVPLDPALGRYRAETVLAESGARTLVSTHDRAADLRLPAGVTVVTPDDVPAGTADGTAPVAPAVDGESLCYVIYTSGSTGTPKGVAVPHGAVTDLCAWQHRRFGFTAADRSAVVCSQSFDASVMEIWPALTAGASVAVAGDAVRKDPLALARWYAAQGVTFTILPTALGETVLQLAPDDQPPLRHLLLGGDVMRTRPRPGTPYEVVNVYGPTEVTVLCTVGTVDPGPQAGGEEIAIGRPVDNVRLRVLDESGAPVPVGGAGELYVGGPGVARGYLNRPEASAGRFLPDPDGGPDARLYRTGDLVRWTADGRLQFRGRTDDQVKIRGYRVEPEEVSRALNALDGVREAVVLARRNGRGEAYLAAFAVPADPVGDGADDRQAFADLMADALAERLPEYLVPRAWTVLAALPVTAAGKLDRAGLPAPDLVTAAPAASAAATPAAPAVPSASAAPAPRNDVERRLRALWAAEFGTDAGAIAPDASFFDLGGHSITAIRLVNRAREEFGTEYPMVRFYEEPTLRAMAAFLSGSPSSQEDADAGVVFGDAVEHRAPATEQQIRFATGQLGHPLPQVFNVAMRLTLTGDLDVAALRTALTGLVARHEGLRTRIVPAGDDDWQQEMLPAGPVDLPVEDLSGLPAGEREAGLERIAAEAAEAPFDLAAGAGPRLRLLRAGERTWVLLFVLHHAVCDGWAVSLVLKELAALYGAAAKGLPDGLAPEPLQPGAYARWQREHADPAADERKLEFWRRELDGVPFGIDLPLDRPRPEKASGRGGAVMFTVPADVRADVERLARSRGTTPYVVTVAALGRLMARKSGQSDVVFSISYANRERREFESLVACTTSGFALRVRDGEAASFAALTDRVARTSVECIDELLPPRRLAPLMQREGVDMPDRLAVGFAYQSSLDTDIEMPGLTVAVEDLAPAASRAELTFGLVPAGDVLAGMAEYSSDLWDRETVEGWTRDYVELLRDEVRAALGG
ncbi:MupA/Atu3671 family FMN-dependent luciferase-like monooxygenase [Streptomyces aureoversilis]|uniref:MupA/Atu3671 family FMN-dependent luciferase-like monooxygenase n=1 Tax=Streptomyces aureoversilis TaxID=67277 RepID=A0ABW0A7L5_9ACTN